MPLISAIAGDILGSPFEWNAFRGKASDLVFFPNGAAPTDDSILTCAVARALLDARRTDGSVDVSRFGDVVGERIREFACRHPNPKGGYGGRFLRWMLTEGAPAYGSLGNGSAMRVSACAWAARSDEEALELARLSALPTHDHPLGILGAEATALAIRRFRQGEAGRKQLRAEWPERFSALGRLPEISSIRTPIPFDATCPGTVPFAVALALDGSNWEETVRQAVVFGGDCDTTAAIAGSIAAGGRSVPAGIRERALILLPPDLRQVVDDFSAAFGENSGRRAASGA